MKAREPKTADTPRALIIALGGIYDVAAICDRHPEAVRHWMTRGIPAHALSTVQAAAAHRRIRVSKAVFEPRRYNRKSTIGADRVAP